MHGIRRRGGFQNESYHPRPGDLGRLARAGSDRPTQVVAWAFIASVDVSDGATRTAVVPKNSRFLACVEIRIKSASGRVQSSGLPGRVTAIPSCTALADGGRMRTRGRAVCRLHWPLARSNPIPFPVDKAGEPGLSQAWKGPSTLDSGFPGNQGQRWQEAAKARRSNELGHVLKLPEQEQVRWFGQRTFEFGEFLQQSLSSAEFRATR